MKLSPSERLVKLITPTRFKVEITEEKEGKVIEALYSGDDYQLAFDLACGARSSVAWRGNWIKFSDDGTTKWAVIS